MLRKATVQDLKNISEKLDFRCSDADFPFYQENVNHFVENINKGYNLTSQCHQKLFGERNLGYQPSPSENIFNSWYWMCKIKSTQNGPLSGKKVGVKDCIAVAGIPMMCGSKVLEGFVPQSDATIVGRILNAGGEIYGKTTCEDMCLSCTSYCTVYGPVKNPLDPSKVTGGSSSGNAAALVAGDIELALGSDQGGSVRMPSSCCGLVGLKPTFGLVPFTGCMSMVTCLDHVGPMARKVSDCALLLDAIAGFDDGKDPRQPSFSFKVPEFSKEILKPTDNLRIGILLEGFDVCEPDVIKCVQKAIKLIKGSHKFASIEEVSVPMHKHVSKIYDLCKINGAYHQYMEGGDYLHYAGDLLDNVKSFNITHHPALSLNGGFSEKNNLPVGLQIVGKLWSDSTVLQVAHTFERLLKPLQ